MPDISMCKTEECPLHETCYRFTATPNGHWQSYFAGDPRTTPKLKGKEDKECNFYWETDTKTKDDEKR